MAVANCPAPVLITAVIPQKLHEVWPFLERGLKDICRRLKPDWIPPDVYGALRAEVATACIVSRGPRLLGFFVYHRQNRNWSAIIDLFIWAGWTIPIRERLPADNIAEAFWRSHQYLLEVKRTIGASRIIMITSRQGFARKYGFRQLFTTFEIG